MTASVDNIVAGLLRPTTSAGRSTKARRADIAVAGEHAALMLECVLYNAEGIGRLAIAASDSKAFDHVDLLRDAGQAMCLLADLGNALERVRSEANDRAKNSETSQ